MRHKEFNRNKVLEQCISTFWNSSYSGTSINEIVKITKVNRYSLYNEFENKRGILNAALELYKERYSSIYFSVDTTGKDLKESIQEFYFNFLRSKPIHPSGCFILYIVMEMADNDPLIKSYLQDYHIEINDSLTVIIAQFPGYEEGQDELLQNLIGLFHSSMVYSYIQTEQQRLAFVDLNLNLILQ
ncbi:MAG: TetR/AcrR family transcriptional regulator [Reichenbachiella sp.]